MNIGQKGRRRLVRQNSKLAWDSRVTAPSVKLDLRIECRHLPKKDSFSNADAFCGVWEAPMGMMLNKEKKVSRLPSKQEREVGRTEVVRENENPSFENDFRLEYRFQEQQTYIIRVYDEDLRYATDLKEHDYVGGCIFTLAELLGAPGCTIAKPLQQGKSFVVLSGHEIVETREVLEFRFSGQDLGLAGSTAKKGQMANKLQGGVPNLQSYDVYFKLEKLLHEDQSWTVVWKSEVVKESHPNPTWQAARIPLQLLCDDEPTNPLKISIFEWNRITNDEMIGFVETTVDDLVQKARRGIPVFDVHVEKRKLLGGTKLKKAGVLKVLKASILTIPSMLQFLGGGCDVDLMVAVDCTTANGDWRQDKSLHYSSDAWLNDYQAALFKVGSVFDGYRGKGHTMWGYGGKVKKMEHNYFIMGEKIEGADNLVKAYDKVFSPDNTQLKLTDQGSLKELIETAMFRASSGNKGDRQCYGVLVILTTGVITDVQESVDAICAAAEDAPLSIAVIGIGGSDRDFSNAQLLVNGEEGKLKHSNGVPIARNIAQFVALTDFGGNARECVAEVLRDVPEQFVQYFINAGVKPNPPSATTDFTVSEVFAKKKSSSLSSSSHHENNGKEKKSKKKKKSSKH